VLCARLDRRSRLPDSNPSGADDLDLAGGSQLRLSAPEVGGSQRHRFPWAVPTWVECGQNMPYDSHAAIRGRAAGTSIVQGYTESLHHSWPPRPSHPEPRPSRWIA
jgi:hypothetical protein